MTSDKSIRALIAMGLGGMLLYLGSKLYVDIGNGLPLNVWPVWWLLLLLGAIAYAVRLILWPANDK